MFSSALLYLSNYDSISGFCGSLNEFLIEKKKFQVKKMERKNSTMHLSFEKIIIYLMK